MAASRPEVVHFGEKFFAVSIVTGRPVPSYKIKRRRGKYAVEATIGDEGPVEGGWYDTVDEAEQKAAKAWLAKYQPNWRYKLDTYNSDTSRKPLASWASASLSAASLFTHCESGNVDGVKAALRRGGDVNRIWQHGSCGNLKCPKDPNCDFKRTPLQGAIAYDRTDVINLLLQEPNIDINLTTAHNYTALNTACMINRPNIVRQLLKVPGIDPNIPNAFGRTPLFEAYFHKHQDCAKELLEGIPNVPWGKLASLKVNGNSFDPWFCNMLIQAGKKQEKEEQKEEQREVERTTDTNDIEKEKEPCENVVENDGKAKEDVNGVEMQRDVEQTTNSGQIEDEAQVKENVSKAGDQREVERLEGVIENGTEESMSDSGHYQGQPLTPLLFGLVHAPAAKIMERVLLNNDLLNLTACYLDDIKLLKEQVELQAAIENLAQLSITL